MGPSPQQVKAGLVRAILGPKGSPVGGGGASDGSQRGGGNKVAADPLASQGPDKKGGGRKEAT